MGVSAYEVKRYGSVTIKEKQSVEIRGAHYGCVKQVFGKADEL